MIVKGRYVGQIEFDFEAFRDTYLGLMESKGARYKSIK